MPTYSFKDKNTGEIKEEFLWISEVDQFLVDNPHLEQVITEGHTVFVDAWRMGMKKPDTGFREHLGRMKRFYKNSTINND